MSLGAFIGLVAHFGPKLKHRIREAHLDELVKMAGYYGYERGEKDGYARCQARFSGARNEWEVAMPSPPPTVHK